MQKERGKEYKPRTRHINSDGSAKYTNRLFFEMSPYLLQHAHNPVNWYPWGEEAFETAKKLNRPIFLSIGYSTCHWCHVMEEESFEDTEIAEYLNKNYVAIKVDREERPDIDAIYMTAVQLITGQGGWPMSMWLTSDKKPFYAATYLPPRDGDRGARIGFLSILKLLKERYETKKEEITSTSHEIVNYLQSYLKPDVSDVLPTYEIIDKAITTYKKRYDPTNGGVGTAPKFPSSLPIRLLLRFVHKTHDQEVLNMATHTLLKMSQGGMYDHVAGGFHRYSVDEKWIVPHFEKMLYDNALLAKAYIEAFQVTGNSEFKRVAEEILHYLDRDMTSSHGGLYSATDADSLTSDGHREEGYYFTWTIDELEKNLGKEKASCIIAIFGVTREGNFEGRNILHTPKPIDENMRALINESREVLYQERNKRSLPLRDEKILAAWNGLAISAYAKAAFVFNNDFYLEKAKKCAQFVLDTLYANGRLFRSYKDGKTKHNAYLEDYAFLIEGFLDLYEASGNSIWLQKALEFDTILLNHYEDRIHGGFFMTSSDHEALLVREKPHYDGAEPSGNSVQALNLLRLYEYTTNFDYRKRAEKTLQAFTKTLHSQPLALSEMLLAVDFYIDKPKEIIIVTPENKKDEAEGFLQELRKTYIPNSILIVVSEGKDLNDVATHIPLVRGKIAQDNKVTAYVCESGVCKLPTNDRVVFSKQLLEYGNGLVNGGS